METVEKKKTPSKVIIKGKTWTPNSIKEAIEKSDQAVKNALLRIYSFQTEEEKQSQETHATNGKGFNGLDAPILTSFAIQLETKGWLSTKQTALARKKLLKYSKQLFLHIVEKQHATYKKYGL